MVKWFECLYVCGFILSEQFSYIAFLIVVKSPFLPESSQAAPHATFNPKTGAVFYIKQKKTSHSSGYPEILDLTENN